MKHLVPALLAVLALLALPAAALAANITLAADPWCPYNCQAGSKDPGYMVEVAREVFQARGHTVDYVEMDWTAAIEAAREGSIDGIIGAYVEDAPDFVYPSESLGRSVQHFFVRKGDPWRFGGMDSLAGKRVGIIEGYSYGEQMDAFIQANPGLFVAASGEDALADLLERMLSGGLDVILEDRNVFLLKAMQTYVLDKVEDAGQFGQAYDVYIAFAPGDPASAEYARVLSAGIVRLRESGRLSAILVNYGLTDWALGK